MDIIFQKALFFHKESNGLFEPTILPLLKLWGFSPYFQKVPPTQDEIRTTLNKVNFKNIKQKESHILKENSELKVDFSAIIPGYAADKIAFILEEKSIHNYLINIGGEMRIRGFTLNKKPWKIGIEMPDNPIGKTEKISATIAITNGAIATSGIYRKNKKVKNKVLHHIISPRTGYPAESDIASVTVYAPTALEADAIGTFLLIMGTQKALKWLDQHKSYEAYFIKKDGITAYSPKFRKLIEPLLIANR